MTSGYSDNLVTATLFPCPEGVTVSKDLCNLHRATCSPERSGCAIYLARLPGLALVVVAYWIFGLKHAVIVIKQIDIVSMFLK